MKDQSKTNQELLKENAFLKQKIQELEQLKSERKQAEEALRESEEKNRALFEDGPIESMVVDREGRIIQYNKAFERSSERGSRRLPETGSRMYVDYASNHSTDMRTELMNSIHSKTAKKFNEMPYNDRFLDIHIAPTKEGAIISAINVTGRKQAEEEKRNLEERLHNAEKMEMLGKLAGRVAHDLNNVLGVLSGYSELLMVSIPEGNPLKEYATTIFKFSGKAAKIVEDLLTLTRRGFRVMEVAKFNKIIANLLATSDFDKLVPESCTHSAFS